MKSKIIFGGIVAGIILGGVLTGYIVHRVQRSTVIGEVQSLFDHGEYQAIVDRLLPSLQGNTPMADERLLAANSLYRLRQYDPAQALLDPLLHTGSENANALLLSGWIWIKKNSPIQAQARFEKAASLGMEAESEGGMGAVSMLRSENYRSAFLNEADFHLKKSISIDPKNPNVYLAMAELKRLQHQYDEAASMAQRAIDLAPYWSEPYGMLGQIYLLNGQFAKAEQAFTNSQKYGGSEEESKYYLALSVYYQGRLSDSLALMEELIQNGQEMVRDALLVAGKISQVLENSKAVGYFQRAWDMKSDPMTGMQLYEVLSHQGEKEKADSILNSVITDWPFMSFAHLEMGNVLLKRNELVKAFSSYQNVLDNDARNFWANYNLGYIAQIRGDKAQAQAQDYFETAAREVNDYFPAQVNLVLSELDMERITDADALLENLLNRYSDKPYLMISRALERFAAGDTRAALDSLDRALQMGQNKASSYMVLGEIQLRLFLFDKARDSFQKALEADASNLRAKLGLAHASYRLSDLTRAESLYQELFNDLSSLPEGQQAEIRNGLAVIALERSDLPKASEIWEQLKKSNFELSRLLGVTNEGLVNENSPGNTVIEDLKVASVSRNPLPETLYNLALFLDTVGHAPESAEAYENLLKRYPVYLPGLFNLANLYSLEGRNGDAASLYNRAHQIAPERIDVLNNQAAVLTRLSRLDQAKESLNQAESIDAGYNEIHYNQILLALRDGRMENAKSILSTLQSGNPSSTMTLFADGLIKAFSNDWGGAEGAFKEVCHREPQDAYASLNHGISLLKLKRYVDAEAALRESVQRDPALVDARRSLGLLYCTIGLYDQARDILQSALQLDPAQTDLQSILDQINRWIGEVHSLNP